MVTPKTAMHPSGLTAVAGIRVGHWEMAGRPTGCTVVLAEGGAVAGVDVRGGGPGTRETALLDPINTVDAVHAVMLAGGSAFGLDAAGGVMRFLEEQGVGFPVGPVRVPIVAGAILFDLLVGGDPTIRPDADCGYQAAVSATTEVVVEGNVGAGAGATVGKLRGMERAMKGGLGSAALVLPGGPTVAALIALNAIGDVIDPASGTVVAGVRTADGQSLADARRLLLEGVPRAPGTPASSNTTLGVLATDAVLTKAQATRVALMAHDGLARTLYPAHTPLDGDTLFVLATGRHRESLDLGLLGALGAEVTARAVLRAARGARGIAGFPAAQDLAPQNIRQR
jgi:L-aminopeptidase/D-esterase-like protein